MENNLNSGRQFQSEQLNGSDFFTGNSNKENFKEFKNSVLLHEKGLEMQEEHPNHLKSKKKTVSTFLTIVNPSENIDEVNELRHNFTERHQ